MARFYETYKFYVDFNRGYLISIRINPNENVSR